MLVAALVEATQDLLQNREAEDLTVTEIAKRAGVGVGSIYEYFNGREGIFNAVVDSVAPVELARIERAFVQQSSAPIDAAFAAALDECLLIYLGAAPTARACLRAIVRFDRMSFFVESRDRLAPLLAGRITYEMPGVDRREAQNSVQTMIDMTMGIVAGELYRPADDRRLASIRAVVLRAIRGELQHLVSR